MGRIPQKHKCALLNRRWAVWIVLGRRVCRKDMWWMKIGILLMGACLFYFTATGHTCAKQDDQQNTEQSGIKTILLNKKKNNEVELLPNITYAVIGEKALRLHLLLPKNVSKPCPLILYIKGSGWGKNHPQKSLEFIPQLVEFAKSGYVVASVEHRTSHEVKFPGQLHDVKAAVRFLRANAMKFNINPEKVGAWGSSSGGHLAALLGTSGGLAKLEGKEGNQDRSSRVQAVVDWYGPTDLLQMGKFSSKVDFDSPNSAESFMIGGALQQNKEKVKMANPITYITPDDPPFLIMHGDKDQRVPFNQSVLLFNALKKANLDVTMYKIKGAGHGGFSQPDNLHTVKQFFDLQLKKK